MLVNMGAFFNFWRLAMDSEVLARLRIELENFWMRGLKRLAANLEKGLFLGETWGTCPLSYARGYCGSRREDSNGANCNLFTDAWDHGRVSRKELLREVRREIRRREKDRKHSV